MEESSKLIEVVRPGQVNIFADLHLSAFRDGRHTEDDDRNILTEGGLLADSMGGFKQEFRPKT
jgi:hypothetical protein